MAILRKDRRGCHRIDVVRWAERQGGASKSVKTTVGKDNLSQTPQNSKNFNSEGFTSPKARRVPGL